MIYNGLPSFTDVYLQNPDETLADIYVFLVTTTALALVLISFYTVFKIIIWVSPKFWRLKQK